MGKNLVYTLALDPPGQTGHRNLAKMLVSSLLRTRFSGDILVFHNSPAPLFMVPRTGVHEVSMPMRRKNFEHPLQFVTYAQSCKHAIHARIPTAQYEKVMFIDCDSIALRNIDHLFTGAWDFAVTVESNTKIQGMPYGAYLTPRERRTLRRPGLNSGTWAVSAKRLKELLRWWRKVEAGPVSGRFLREQSAFNRVALDWNGVLHKWPRREIALPFVDGNLQTYGEYSQAAIVHTASGAFPDFKLRFLFGMYAANFLFDSQLALINILEM